MRKSRLNTDACGLCLGDRGVKSTLFLTGSWMNPPTPRPREREPAIHSASPVPLSQFPHLALHQLQILQTAPYSQPETQTLSSSPPMQQSNTSTVQDPISVLPLPPPK
jgi:hypothetical protein